VTTIDDVRRIVADLPRSYEVLVRDRVKFRVGRIVYLAFSRDESIMGFAFRKEERDALVAAEPDQGTSTSSSTARTANSASTHAPMSRACAAAAAE
jgi:hypothetical protein